LPLLAAEMAYHRHVPSDVPEIIVPTRQGYDRWSQVYDNDGNPLVALEEPEAIRMMGQVRGLTMRTLGPEPDATRCALRGRVREWSVSIFPLE